MTLREEFVQFLQKPGEPAAAKAPSIPRKKTIEVKDFTPETISTNLLKQLEAAGFEAPIIFGGAIRDDYLRNKMGLNVTTSDYDIEAYLDPKLLQCGRDYQVARRVLEHHIMHSFPGCKKVNVVNLELSFGGTADGCVEFRTREGLKVHFFIKEKEGVIPPLSDRDKQGDAPINRVFMDSSGAVMADPAFAEHITRRVYRPFKPIREAWAMFDARLGKLTHKIPGLRYQDAALEPYRIVGEDGAAIVNTSGDPMVVVEVVSNLSPSREDQFRESMAGKAIQESIASNGNHRFVMTETVYKTIASVPKIDELPVIKGRRKSNVPASAVHRDHLAARQVGDDNQIQL